VSVKVSPPFPLFVGSDGLPLEAAFVYIGTANLDPVTNPVTVYSDSSLSTTLAQPIRTLAGAPVNNGSPVNLFVAGNYSITVKDKNGVQVYTNPSAALAGGDITLAAGETLLAEDGSTVNMKSGSTLRLGDATGAGVAIIVDAPTRITGNWVPTTSGTRLGQLTQAWDLFARNITMTLAFLPSVAGVPFIGSLTLPFLTMIARTVSAKSASFYSTTQPSSTADLVKRTQLDCFLSGCNQTNAGAGDGVVEELKNVSGITQPGVGTYQITFTRNLGTGVKVAVASARDAGFRVESVSCGATSCVVTTKTTAGAAASAAFSFQVHGNPGEVDPIS